MQLGSGRSAVHHPDPGPPAPESSSHTQWGHTGKAPTFSGDKFPLTVEWKPCTLLFPHSCTQCSTISGHSLKSVPRHRRGAHRSPAEQLWPDQGSAPPSALPPLPESPLMPLTTQHTAPQTIMLTSSISSPRLFLSILIINLQGLQVKIIGSPCQKMMPPEVICLTPRQPLAGPQEEALRCVLSQQAHL